VGRVRQDQKQNEVIKRMIKKFLPSGWSLDYEYDDFVLTNNR
jgi:hypothetical protein